MESNLKIITDSILQRYCTTLTDNIYKDQNGYLVCEGAILGRTGSQEYTERELGISKSNNIVKVYRLEEYVFDSSSMLSLEGRPLTLKHPKELVSAENHYKYAKGEVFNVRREGDNLVGDIRATDPQVIDIIMNKKMRELSLGYTQNLVYDESKGIYYFTDIVYNHIALVKKGRAGNAIIKDSFIEDEIDEETFKEILTETLQPIIDKVNKLEDEKKVEEVVEEQPIEEETREGNIMVEEQVKVDVEPIEHIEVPSVEELKPKANVEKPQVEEEVKPNVEEKVVERIVYVDRPVPTPTPQETTTKFDLGENEEPVKPNRDIEIQNEFYSYQKLQGESYEQWQQRLATLVQSKSLKRQYQESRR